MMDKKQLFKQIKNFNQQLINPGVKNSQTYEQAYLYVSEKVAEDRAAFFKFLLENDAVLKTKDIDEKPVVLDLAFGSGNLTCHLIYENDIEPTVVMLNDKNTENTNQELESYEGIVVMETDVLDNKNFEEFGSSLIIFNPQIGGNYENGRIELENNVKPIVAKNYKPSEFLTYLKEEEKRGYSDFVINVFDDEREIVVYSQEMSKSDMAGVFKDLKVFNYYNVSYQSKKSKKETRDYNIVKFRQTFDKVFAFEWGVVVFYGKREYFDILFADFNYVVEYWADEGEHLFVATITDNTAERHCFERNEKGDFVAIPNCEKSKAAKADLDDLMEIQGKIEVVLEEMGFGSFLNKETAEVVENEIIKTEEMEITPKENYKLDWTAKGDWSFELKNILLKGVPGTGKSRLINQLIERELGLSLNDKNVLRINIHSASSNADLMQGIGITTNKNNQVEYQEKQGLILRHIKNAIRHPDQPFVVVLEEIQENSLNELIGDLIYLIEEDKRVDIPYAEYSNQEFFENEFESEEDFLERFCVHFPETAFVELPFLVAAKTEFRKMVLPTNLYVFCTSNYRDDKKVIEDNLLRRFEVIELYPKENIIKNEAVQQFLNELNAAILEQFHQKEIHPDRFMIGHAIWLNVTDKVDFCRALLKVVTEFKDVKEIEFDEFLPIFETLELPFDLDKSEIIKDNYQFIIKALQAIAYKNILNFD